MEIMTERMRQKEKGRVEEIEIGSEEKRRQKGKWR